MISSFEKTAKTLDNKHNQSTPSTSNLNSSIFSEGLFNTRSDKLIDYVKEITIKHHQLTSLVSAQNIELTSYQLVLLEQQISSLINAFRLYGEKYEKVIYSENTPRASKLKMSPVTIKAPAQNLYQSLSEHHEFERRLLQMISDKEQERRTSEHSMLEKTSQDLLVLQGRLGRCRQALTKIETDILTFESKYDR